MVRVLTLLTHGALASSLLAQELLQYQNNTFNSSYAFSEIQIDAANISDSVANNVQVALNVERTNWATGSVAEDQFYNPPPVNASTPPGSLLKVQEYTNTSTYTLAPNLALSRILFTSVDFNGSIVPASAYVLWPWQARKFPDSCLNVSGVPAVAWAHGTSGVFGECAPSHIRNLWYQFSAPFTLALQGYAVVAPDYAGLGVNHTAEGDAIVHQYLAHPAAANDLFYAMQAAQMAFPELSKQFITMGHSQGGGAAWATAHRQSVTPVEGYLGTVAGSPDPNNYENIKATSGFGVAPRIARGLSSIFPSFNYSEWFEPEGVKRLPLLEELSGCNSVNGELFPQAEGLIKPAWEENWYLRAYSNISDPSRKPISGPMLVVQGTGDQAVPAAAVSKAVNETCAMYPKNQIRYASFEGASHVPVLNAAQQIWLQWIEDRFMGKDVDEGCTQEYHRPLRRRVASYQKELEYYLQLAVQSYEVA
ncbi:uncharacterized protein N0V89_008186 [Didymosphaeria variabile]|uniref:AB hydrolase-1 domain-containing protein n=1 Tax=Didymosphaeria variabile TaxID=1932322 RepID=A0A9W8XFU3_9PLEO|nr:uncharacterized protein N0V89_008186 [Didymosphaeria variabile]KAJ4349570.1 hypothetical protein N0V89_008186 [Didymosphaeria variabile]